MQSTCNACKIWLQSIICTSWGFYIVSSHMQSVTGLTLPSRCSCVEQLSINVCAMIDKHESTIGDLLMSNRNSGFFITFTQKRSSRLHNEWTTKSNSHTETI